MRQIYEHELKPNHRYLSGTGAVLEFIGVSNRFIRFIQIAGRRYPEFCYNDSGELFFQYQPLYYGWIDFGYRKFKFGR